MVEFNRRQLMATSLAASVGASVAGGVVSGEQEDTDTEKAPSVDGEITRFASTALGAEVTGPFILPDGTLIFSLQHPSRENPEPFNSGGIGYVKGYQFEEGSDFDELSVPNTEEERRRVRAAEGEYTLLAREGDNLGNNEDLGMPLTPDGLSIDEFAGSRYSDFGYQPDMNQFIPTNEAGTEGLLFTNFETSPGNVTRMPISQDEKGVWSADLEEAVNLSNTEELRSLGGTRINCYGDVSPWNTPLTSEEEYAHTRTAYTSTVSDIVEDGTGVGHRGGAQFWNRPNPSEIQAAIDEYYGEESWDVQGYWALGGVELLAYYLGAERVDQASGYTENTKTPIPDNYPNPYRTGYIVDFREPESETPKPVKYHVFGRAAWECPDIQSDEKTAYVSSDGANKGFYKFVADEPIPSYDDPMDVEGTLYAAKVTNKEAAAKKSPAEAELEIEWLPLSRASNAEIAEWIAEYDDVSQVDYLETHADTDWEEDLQAALEEADKEVAENGNRNYITDEEIKEWGELWSEDPESTVADRGREDLRKVPFLETRAAAKEIGATVEFRKSEGIDSVDDAGPGDYVYIGISEVNDGMSDDAGDIRTERVDGGLVYRGKLEDDYNISTLEPVIVGPDATDPADVANDALVNVDNVYVMDDGRVLCCEDADQFGRSYKNDCMYVYTPPELKDDGDDGGDESEETTEDSGHGNGNGSNGHGNGNDGNGSNGNGHGN
ncbi:alkaline phosphatase PhoX [Halopelagius fulvigenes]|uniref:Alkaline phosphatase PhoX n=1 Tax=Halopelagius fulvigenes TaxID=1198324 RepID=A0ABD5TUG3_9EURY